jgi:hypothetical protein
VAAAQPEALKDVTNEATGEKEGKAGKAQARPRERRERGPPADGIPSKTKVMVANLPYDLTEEKVRCTPRPPFRLGQVQSATNPTCLHFSSRSCSARTSPCRPRSPCALSPVS